MSYRVAIVGFVPFVFLVHSACTSVEVAEEIDARIVVETLASDDLEGRLTGSVGSRKAGDYIIGELQRVGLSLIHI